MWSGRKKYFCFLFIVRGSRPEVFCNKDVLKNFWKNYKCLNDLVLKKLFVKKLI